MPFKKFTKSFTQQRKRAYDQRFLNGDYKRGTSHFGIPYTREYYVWCFGVPTISYKLKMKPNDTRHNLCSLVCQRQHISGRLK